MPKPQRFTSASFLARLETLSEDLADAMNALEPFAKQARGAEVGTAAATSIRQALIVLTRDVAQATVYASQIAHQAERADEIAALQANATVRP